ncbi:hypothetical protein SAMN05443244_2125 [Terriglobus roseus]|uniref:Uncharacterized protein n=1 Tax=Terriglobus roseus TaxID=392734 RepID=A0A1H4N402_9BACT|nr:hypothetical protein SAMN05443244_2125 [Terriglobus roseus]
MVTRRLYILKALRSDFGVGGRNGNPTYRRGMGQPPQGSKVDAVDSSPFGAPSIVRCPAIPTAVFASNVFERTQGQP